VGGRRRIHGTLAAASRVDDKNGDNNFSRRPLTMTGKDRECRFGGDGSYSAAGPAEVTTTHLRIDAPRGVRDFVGSPMATLPSAAAACDSIWEEYLRLARDNVPKGFDNFVPKKKSKTSSGDEASKGDEDKQTEEDKGESSAPDSGGVKDDGGPFASFGKKGGQKKGDGSGFGGSGPGGDPQMPPLIATALLAAMVIFLLVRADRDDDGDRADGPGGREVTWSDFRNHMLESGDVERIVVTNKNTVARVFLRPGARGLPSRGDRRVGGSRMGAMSGLPLPSKEGTRGGSRPRRRGAVGEEDFEDGTVMEMGPDSSRDASADMLSSPFGGGGFGSGGMASRQLVYRFAIGSVDTFERNLEEAQKEMGVDPRNYVPVQYASDSTLVTELLSIVPSLLLIGVVMFMMRGAMGGMGGGGAGGGGGPGGIFQFGKSKAKKIKKEDINVSFKDVAGCQEAKKEIMEFVDFLQDSTRFTKLGAKIPKGALLCGPPGTGKTLLAKAVAGEAGVPFYSISGSDFIEMFVGVGPSRVRDLFKEARSNSPCIVFIDEIDAIGRKRGRGGMSGGNDERENTLNQLLVEMDGFTPSSNVVILAGTNRVDILDEALTRPGRFDRQIQVDKPDLQGRKEIFLVHLKDITLEGKAGDFAGRLAGLTPGFAGADIANICNEAAIVAARRKADAVTMEDFETATDRVIGGLESNKLISKEERDIVAHHEAGHAVAGWFLEHADPLLKVTIIPRSGGALGFAQYLPKEVFLRTQDQIMDIVCMALAGRAAEEVFFGSVTTGASNDLQKVTELVYSTIQLYGMNDRLGQLAFPRDPNAMFEEKPYSSKTAQAMDEEAKHIVDEAYKRTVDLVREKKEEVEKLATLLLEKETITHDDIVDLIGPRPFKGDPAYEEFVRRRKEFDEEIHKDEDRVEEDDNQTSGNSGANGDLSPGMA